MGGGEDSGLPTCQAAAKDLEGAGGLRWYAQSERKKTALADFPLGFPIVFKNHRGCMVLAIGF